MLDNYGPVVRCREQQEANRREIEKQEAQIEQKLAKAAVFHRASLSLIPQGQEHFARQIVANQAAATQALSRISLACHASWGHAGWTDWTPTAIERVSQLRIGHLSSGVGDSTFVVPVFVPFIGKNRTVIVTGPKDQNQQALSLLQSLVVRTALILPHQTQYTLLDPAGNGMAYPMRKLLPKVKEGEGDLRQQLDEISQNIQRVIANYLDASIRSFDLLPLEIRVNEPYHLVFAADFPNRYDRRAIEALQHIGVTGPAAGTYLFIQYNQDYPLPRELSLDGFENGFVVQLGNGKLTELELTPTFDSAPSAAVQTQLLGALGSAKQPQLAIRWMTVVCPPESQWWTQTSETMIQTPIGVQGRQQSLDVWFGVKASEKNRPCAHGVLGAMTGAGKSNLYHVLISGLAVRYSPSELQFYLVDGKDGVEFQPYRSLPHAAAVSLRTSPELSRSILADLVAEKERRNDLFSRVGATDIGSYRRLGHQLPRILLLVDEYQELFEGDREGLASSHLLQLAQQGRSVGIHMLLGSQAFSVKGMLDRDKVFGNMHLRMAMMLPRADVRDLTDFGRRGKALIDACSLPGQIVINDQGGDEEANRAGKVSRIEAEEIVDLVNKLGTKVDGLPNASVPRRVVLDGAAQPNLAANPYLAQMLTHDHWLSPVEREDFGRSSLEEGGLGIVEWYKSEVPYVAWLGQEFTLRGHLRVVLRRHVAENLVVAGGSEPIRQGIVMGMMACLASNAGPKQSEYYFFSGTDNTWSVEEICSRMLRPSGFVTFQTSDSLKLEALLARLLASIASRQEMTSSALLKMPSIFVTFADLDRVPAICRKSNSYGDLAEPPLGLNLKRLFTDGPAVGIHTILSFSGVTGLTAVLEPRRSLPSFRHRVALQMSEDDSYTFVKNQLAARLQNQGPKPIKALYRDISSDSSTLFRPYSADPEMTENKASLARELTGIGDTLAARR